MGTPHSRVENNYNGNSDGGEVARADADREKDLDDTLLSGYEETLKQAENPFVVLICCITVSLLACLYYLLHRKRGTQSEEPPHPVHKITNNYFFMDSNGKVDGMPVASIGFEGAPAAITVD